jgi:membrane protease YdiL (CAAX protease family)
MQEHALDRILFALLFTALLGTLLGILATWSWAMGRLWRGEPLLNPRHRRYLSPAPWGAATVFAVLFLYLLVSFTVGQVYAIATEKHPGNDSRLEKQQEAKAPDAEDRKEARSADEPEESEPDAPVPPANDIEGPGEREAEEPSRQTQADVLIQLAIINGLLIFLIPEVARRTSGATLNDLGIRLDNWRGQVGIGVVAAFLMTPAVYAVQSLAVQYWEAQKHDVETMVLREFSLGTAVLAIFSTMVLAPIVEELLFRGILQRWLTRLIGPRPARPTSAAAGIPSNIAPDLDLPSEGDVLSEMPGHEVATETPSTMLAVVLTSIAFAVVHLPQWPAPIAIFLLSMGLGIVYEYTGSLLTVMALHGTFNGFSTLLLLLQALGRQIQPVPIVNGFVAMVAKALGIV